MIGTDTVFDYYSETFQLPDGSYVNCEIMDTGGQEIYDSINRSYYQRADCCLLVYDVTRKITFESIEKFYIKEIKNNCCEDIKVILVGNKTDLKDKREISTKEGANLATKYKFIFKETSCEQNFNVVDVFETIIIMTNNDMIESGRQNFGEKEQIQPFKLKDGDNETENNEVLKIDNNDNLKDLQKKVKTKKSCC